MYALAEGKDCFFSGGKDKKIFQFDRHGSPIGLFEGHTNAVNCLRILDDEHIISGSWDATAKIWNIESKQCVGTLAGHEHAVSILVLQDGRIITGSRDEKI